MNIKLKSNISYGIKTLVGDPGHIHIRSISKIYLGMSNNGDGVCFRCIICDMKKKQSCYISSLLPDKQLIISSEIDTNDPRRHAVLEALAETYELPVDTVVKDLPLLMMLGEELAGNEFKDILVAYDRKWFE